MLHFRSLFITGLMVGAAVFLPHIAFAEKNVPSVKTIPQKAAVQVNHTDAQKGKNMVVHQPAVNRVVKTTPPQAASQKPVAVPQNVAAKSKGKSLSALTKNAKTVKAPGLIKAAVVKDKNKTATQNKAVSSSLKSVASHHIGVETKPQPKELVISIQLQKESAQLTEPRFERIVTPSPLKKEKPPVSQEELPKISQMLNQAQRTNSSGGDSNDRVSHGSSTVTGMDKWLEWDFYQLSQLVQLYASRQSFIQNQWMNAPPSPPPQAAPFYKNVNRR